MWKKQIEHIKRNWTSSSPWPHSLRFYNVSHVCQKKRKHRPIARHDRLASPPLAARSATEMRKMDYTSWGSAIDLETTCMLYVSFYLYNSRNMQEITWNHTQNDTETYQSDSFITRTWIWSTCHCVVMPWHFTLAPPLFRKAATRCSCSSLVSAGKTNTAG